MAYEIFLAIKNNQLDHVKGAGVRDRDTWIPILSYKLGTSTTRDKTTGLPSGKRQHQPIMLVKETDVNSHKLIQHSVSGDTLTAALKFTLVAGSPGTEHGYETMELINARITNFKTVIPKGSGRKTLEELTLVYEDLTYNNVSFPFPPAHLQTAEPHKAAHAV